MTHRQAAGRSSGFTLIELMIVVAIIAVLAVVAIGGITRMIRRSRRAEVGAVFGAFAAGEEAYKSEKGTFIALDSTTGANNGSPSSFFPALASNEPVAKAWQGSSNSEPASWSLIPFNYTQREMYCGYSGDAGVAPTNYPNSDGAQWGGTFPANYPSIGPWYYVAAECNWNGSATTYHYEMRYDQEGTVLSLDGD
jgi:prepilin-type N-terminal cleavage/methylation domain-containing protein